MGGWVLLAIILISSEIYILKVVILWAVNDSKAWDPWPLTSTCQADKLNSFTAIDAHESHLFDKLLWGLVTSAIFVRC